jgi:predicted AlkP superfamily phosphohydrolase/phosphomutase
MTGRFAIIGLDCAEPSLVFDRWLGDLPNLNGLIQRGLWGELRTIDPPISVPAWACLATGLDPGQLGIYGFRNRTDHSYTALATADSRWLPAGRAIWDVLGAAGKHVVVLSVPQTYPPFEVNGELVSCFLTPDTRRSKYTHPAELQTEIESVLGAPYKVDVEHYRSDERDRILAEIYDMTEQRFTLARHLVSSRPWDFFMMHEIGLDRIQHGFWRFMDSRHRDHQPDHRYRDVIRQYYCYLDDQIGGLVELLGDDTTVLIVSDHGAQRMEGAVLINEWLLREGYLALADRPTGLQPLARVAVDWTQTRVWGEGGHYCRLCLNVRGREPHGIVDPADYEPLRAELIARLEAMPGPDGQAIGTRVYRPEELWAEQRGIPPDLVVYVGDLAWRSNGSLGSGHIFSFDNDTGPDDANHTRYGLCVLTGPAYGSDRQTGLTIYDVAPTVLQHFGLPILPEMRGRPMASTPIAAVSGGG